MILPDRARLPLATGYLNLPELIQDLLRTMTFPRHVCLPSRRAQYLIFQLGSFEGVRSHLRVRKGTRPTTKSLAHLYHLTAITLNNRRGAKMSSIALVGALDAGSGGFNPNQRPETGLYPTEPGFWPARPGLTQEAALAPPFGMGMGDVHWRSGRVWVDRKNCSASTCSK